MRSINIATMAVFSLLVRPANADSPPATHLDFLVYAAGLNVVRLQSDVEFAADRYRVNLTYQTAGLFGAIFSSQITSFAHGRWSDAQPKPVRFASWGQLRGEERRTVIDYVNGQPAIRELRPATDTDRDPVPLNQQHDTIDTLSAIAMLVRQVATMGRCDGHAMTFDGRRLSEINARTVGSEELKPEGGSEFSGTALRCEIIGRQLAGFKHDEDDASLRKLHYSTVWLAPVVPTGPKLPVRVVFETPFFGHATAYLTAAAPRGPIE